MAEDTSKDPPKEEKAKDKVKHTFKLAMDSLNDENAYDNLEFFYDGSADIDWQNIHTQSIFNAAREKNVGRPIAIIAYINTLTKRSPLKLGNGDRTDVFDISIKDHEGTEINCFRMIADELSAMIDIKKNRKRPLKFYGTVISVIYKYTEDYFFFIHDIETKITAEDLQLNTFQI